MVKGNRLLIVLDLYDPILTEEEMLYFVSVMSEQATEVDIQLLTPKLSLARKLRTFGKVLPPIRMISSELEKNVTSWQFQLNLLEISMHLRKLTYLAPNLSILWWSDIKSRIQNNCYLYTQAITLSQGISSYYVADMVQAEKKYMWLHTNTFFTGEWKKVQSNYFEKFEQIFTASLSVKAFYQQHYETSDLKWISYAQINYARILNKLIAWQQDTHKKIKEDYLLTYQPSISQMETRRILSFLQKIKHNQDNVYWVIIGEIENEEKFRRQLQQFQLEGYVQLIQKGMYAYSFFSKVDKYIQLNTDNKMTWAAWDAVTLGMPILHLSGKQEVSWKAWLDMAKR
ncbi:hypothetical protein [Saliterribacillus persicus]|uniref:Glycosyl transferase family 1 domain-containing protein n=1 Tax=Saliterribacillus persicus TaxID=930114 RepID=A0A368Y3T4_9BACI|nr:hypothetical protein [Saliterribacillus persicus]RCW74852.1 hypothetical protein DFR57_103148 [Saliterribacillus persicus]